LSYAANRELPYDASGLVSAAAFAPLLASGVVNPFGPNAEDVLAQMRATQVTGRESDNRAIQYGADFKATRELVQLPAGPLAVALGVEGRRETLEMRNAEFLYTGDIIGGNGALPSIDEASRRVGSFFAEANVPIVAALEADLAVRADHYSDFGTTTNPKATLRWMASKQLLLRASYGSGFRAPTLYELYLPGYGVGTVTHVADPARCPATQAPEDCDAEFPVVKGGNADLQPEESRQLNAGLVLEPSRALSMAADYYRVRLTHVIAPMTLEAALDGYNVRGPPDPQHPGLPGPIEYLRNVPFNVASLETSGIDVDVRWRIPLRSGRLSLSLAGTYVLTYEPDSSQPASPSGPGERAFGAGAIARWRHYAAVDWSRGPWGATLAQTFQSGYDEVDRATCAPGRPAVPAFCTGERRVGSYSVLDLQGRYTGIPKLTLAVGVRNLLDRAPPTTTQTTTFQIGIDPTYADPRGRMWYGSLRYAFR
jgi:iron complex outermembrane receptor protein